jgi:hypothetical protein
LVTQRLFVCADLAHSHGVSSDVWKVRPHGPLEQPSRSLLTVIGDLKMPLAMLERRMTVARLRDGRLVVYSAMALDDTQMSVLEAHGRPAFLVVPNAFHRTDLRGWKERYPDITVVAPSGARDKVADIVPVDTTAPEFDDDALRFVEVPGTAGREGALEVREDGRLTLVLNDIVGNLPRSDGWVLRAIGFATLRPRIPRMVRRTFVKDAAALRRQFEAWAEQPVERILVSHGRPIVDDACDVLRDLAQSLR